MSEVVAHTEAPLTRDKNADSPLGNLLTDLVREATGTDVAVIPGGSLKDDIEPGPVDVGEVYSAFPFESHVVKVDLKGSDLKKLMEESVSLVAKKVMQVSGLQVTFNPDRPAGQRLVEVRQEDGTPIRDDQTYRVAADDFLLAGGDNYTAVRGMPSHLGDKVQDLLVRQLRSRGTIGAQPAGERIRAAHDYLPDDQHLSQSA